ncbi:MAG: alpha/beta fold hydrolase [Planctomycetes bacterium]|nr:alpha/beta fold hydrolase [Planctomycetota bacterium]
MRRKILVALLAPIVAIVVGLVALWNWPAGFEWTVRRLSGLAFGLSTTSIVVGEQNWPVMERGADGSSPGLPPLLLLHGFGTSKEAMTLLAAMRPGQRVIAPDLPGFGDHPLPDGVTPDVAWYVEQVDLLRAALGIEHMDLGGTSMGGALATAYAIAHPERVDRLVLLAPAGVTPPVLNDFMKLADTGANPLDIQSRDDLVRIMGLVFEHPPPVPEPLMRAMVDRAQRLRPSTLRILAALRPFLTGGLDGQLGGVLAPTLVLYGAEDRVTDPSMAHVFGDGIRLSTVVVVPDAGHVPFSDAPEAVRDAMQSFLDAPRPAANRRGL